ncbi:hypothetical protein DFS33DRAFT_1444727 [Desarmillaria ectypa]|nr:hypothetical protein DFS33DRAFT_1444727 [Desarmillaria ectypa]
MSSEKTRLPPIKSLLRMVPTPGQQLGELVQPKCSSVGVMLTSPAVITIGSDGYESIEGPLTQNQRHIFQGRAHGSVLKRCPPGNNYVVPKRPPLDVVARTTGACDEKLCLSPEGAFHTAMVNSQPLVYTRYMRTECASFRMFLHQNPKDRRSTLPIYSVIPFISPDSKDSPLKLPGISISRLLSKERDILVNANSFIEETTLGSNMQVINVNIIIKGYEHRGRGIKIPLECSHGFLTHLGLAQTISETIYHIIHEVGPLSIRVL